MAKLLTFWRELIIAGLIGAVLLFNSTLSDRDETIINMKITMAEMAATTATDTKWTTSQLELFQVVMDRQNAGIQSVLDGLAITDANIRETVDRTRIENARKVTDLQNVIRGLPTATNCEVMMSNMIQSGAAIQW